MTKPPKLTKKQQEIVKLLYRFRFLNRIQIQAFLGHKDPKTINLWLRDLRAKGYVEWIYSTHFAEKTKPAVYYLGLNGVRYLRTLTGTSKDEDGETYRQPTRQKSCASATKNQPAAKPTLTVAFSLRSAVLRLSGQMLKMRPRVRYAITTRPKQITYLSAVTTISSSTVSLSSQV